jgi:hypothetical protein
MSPCRTIVSRRNPVGDVGDMLARGVSEGGGFVIKMIGIARVTS